MFCEVVWFQLVPSLLLYSALTILIAIGILVSIMIFARRKICSKFSLTVARTLLSLCYFPCSGCGSGGGYTRMFPVSTSDHHKLTQCGPPPPPRLPAFRAPIEFSEGPQRQLTIKHLFISWSSVLNLYIKYETKKMVTCYLSCVHSLYIPSHSHRRIIPKQKIR